MPPTVAPVSPGRHSGTPRLPPLGNALVLMLLLGCGCRLLHSAATLPAHTARTIAGQPGTSAALDPVLLQERLMRFADDYSGRLLVAMDSLPAPTNSASAIARLHLKLDCLNNIYAVATGPNEFMNLADMFVLVSLARTIVEEQWLPGPYSHSVRPMLIACQMGLTNITAIALSVVSPEQLAELRAAIAQWQQGHPDLRGALFARGLGLEVEMAAREHQPAAAPASLFSLLHLDPLASLDPAARELAQTRLLGERVVFLAHRKPTLLRWQGELFVLETAQTPPVREVRTNITEAAAALQRAGKTVERLPDLVSRTLNQTLEPTNFARLSNQVAPVIQQAQAGGQAVADYAFHKALLLVGFTCLAVLITALAFHWLRRRANPP